MVIWVTGGIGSGKSAAVQVLRDAGADTVDLDQIVRALHERPDVRASVAALLELPSDYTRAQVAEIVFHDPARLSALEQLLHPLVWTAVEQVRKDRVSPLVIEMPLPPRPEPGDLILVIEAPLELRIKRLAQRGMSEEEALARIGSAPTAETYRHSADSVVVNDGDIQHLQDQVQRFWNEVQHG